MVELLGGRLPMFYRLLLLVYVCSLCCTPTESRFIEKRAAQFYIANETMCIVDGDVYRNGDPVPTDDECERCTCRPPGFSCVLRDCDTKPGCKAVRKVGECCPEYVCGCVHNNRLYEDGELIKDLQNSCYTCRCHGSSISCIFADCHFRGDCQPEYIQGECCPRYDHCPPITPSTTTTTTTSPQGQFQQEIEFVNFTTHHVERFTSEGTTVTIQDIVSPEGETTTPAYEISKDSLLTVKFTLTGEKLSSIHDYDITELTTLLPLKTVSYTETTKHVSIPHGTEVTTWKGGLISEESEITTTSSSPVPISTETPIAETEADSFKSTSLAPQDDTSTKEASSTQDVELTDEDVKSVELQTGFTVAEESSSDVSDTSTIKSTTYDENLELDVKTTTVSSSDSDDLSPTSEDGGDAIVEKSTSISDVSETVTHSESSVESTTHGIDHVRITSIEHKTSTDIDYKLPTTHADYSTSEETIKIHTEHGLETSTVVSDSKISTAKQEEIESTQPVFITTASFESEEISTHEPGRESLFNFSSSSDTKFEGLGNVAFSETHTTLYAYETTTNSSLTDSKLNERVPDLETTTQVTSLHTYDNASEEWNISESESGGVELHSGGYDEKGMTSTEDFNSVSLHTVNETNEILSTQDSSSDYSETTHPSSGGTESPEKHHHVSQITNTDNTYSTPFKDASSTPGNSIQFIYRKNGTTIQPSYDDNEENNLIPTDFVNLEVQESQDSETSQQYDTVVTGFTTQTAIQSLEDLTETPTDVEEHFILHSGGSAEDSETDDLGNVSSDQVPSTTVKNPSLIEGGLETYERVTAPENVDQLNAEKGDTKLVRPQTTVFTSTVKPTFASEILYTSNQTPTTEDILEDASKLHESEKIKEGSGASTEIGTSDAESDHPEIIPSVTLTGLGQETESVDHTSSQGTPVKAGDWETKESTTELYSTSASEIYSEGTIKDSVESESDSFTKPEEGETAEDLNETEQDLDARTTSKTDIYNAHETTQPPTQHGYDINASHESEELLFTSNTIGDVSSIGTETPDDSLTNSTSKGVFDATTAYPNKVDTNLIKVNNVNAPDDRIQTEKPEQQTNSETNESLQTFPEREPDTVSDFETRRTTIATSVSNVDKIAIEKVKESTSIHVVEETQQNVLHSTKYEHLTSTTTSPTTTENGIPSGMPDFEPPLANILKQPSIFDKHPTSAVRNITLTEEYGIDGETNTSTQTNEKPPQLSLTLTEDITGHDENNVFVLNHEYTIPESEINDISHLDAEENYVVSGEIGGPQQGVTAEEIDSTRTSTAYNSLQTLIHNTETSSEAESIKPVPIYHESSESLDSSTEETALNYTKLSMESHENLSNEHKFNLNTLGEKTDQKLATLLDSLSTENNAGDDEGHVLSSTENIQKFYDDYPSKTDNLPDDLSTSSETSDDYFNNDDGWKLNENPKISHENFSISLDEAEELHKDELNVVEYPETTSSVMSEEINTDTVDSSKKPELEKTDETPDESEVSEDTIPKTSTTHENRHGNETTEASTVHHSQEENDQDAQEAVVSAAEHQTELDLFPHPAQNESTEDSADYSYLDAELTGGVEKETVEPAVGDLHPDVITAVHDISSTLNSVEETYNTKEIQETSEETLIESTTPTIDALEDVSTVKVNVLFGQGFSESKFENVQTTISPQTLEGDDSVIVDGKSPHDKDLNTNLTSSGPDELNAEELETSTYSTIEGIEGSSIHISQESSEDSFVVKPIGSTMSSKDPSSSFTILEYIGNLFSTLSSLSSVDEYKTTENSSFTPTTTEMSSTNNLVSDKIKPYNPVLTDQLSEYGYLGGVRITGQSKYNGSTSKEHETEQDSVATAVPVENKTVNVFFAMNTNQTGTISEATTPETSEDIADRDTVIKSEDTHKKDVTDLESSSGIEIEDSLLLTATTIIREKGPEKGGDWFEPTDPSISLVNAEREQDKTEMSHITSLPLITEENDDDRPGERGEVTEFPSSEIHITDKTETAKDIEKITIDQNPGSETQKSMVAATNAVTDTITSTLLSSSPFVTETTPENVKMSDHVPPLPILLKHMHQAAVSDDSKSNDETFPNDSPQNDSSNSYYERLEKGTFIPVKVLASARSLEQQVQHAGDIISKVFKAPGYDSEFHSRSWKSPFPKTHMLRWKRNTQRHSQLIPENESKQPPTVVPKTNESTSSDQDEKHGVQDVSHFNKKNVLLVEGYNYKPSDFFPVTSSFIRVESDEETEENEFRKNAKRKSTMTQPANKEFQNGIKLVSSVTENSKSSVVKKAVGTK